jgi:hypothetical protein
LRRARAKLRLDVARGPMLALHIRKGDACGLAGRGDCRGLPYWMSAIRQMTGLYGIRSILLATPSADVHESTRHYPEYSWLFLNQTRPLGGQIRSSSENLLRKMKRPNGSASASLFNPVLEWEHYMMDLYLLASCSAFVGSFQSNAARLAVSLMAGGTSGCARPFYSGDMNWCWAYERTGPDINRVGSRPTGSTAKC